ncbi:gastrula zinc finger protein XlCGF57.1-like isoform X1 [Thalassophryne amazonica]|uniref:gastrula zinc finger protein XlCGF57.1-like isoform X1 n=1 Tax=Thalassophryne amazonica TaxID=390379 RepID=UPI0014720E6D|nr:gastrula zinc finger protein XlCGF57.1-like isoform X1 [Thalassophryne amazonica]
MQQLLVSNEDIVPEQKKWNPSLDQKDSELPNIKEEQEEVWSEDEEKPQSSQLLQSRRDENTEVEFLVSNLIERRTLKKEAHGDDCGGSEPAGNLGPCRNLQPDTDDMQQLQIKEEILPEQQQWNLSVDQEDVRVEKEKLWISQHGQQLHQLEKTDVTKFPFTVVLVKPENDDEKPQSSQVHQSQSDDSTDAKPVGSCLTAHRTLTAQAEEDYGGQQPVSNSGPKSCLHPAPNGRSSDSSETDDSCEWKQTSEDSQEKSCLSVSCSGCNVTKKQFHLFECGKVCGHMNSPKQHTGMQPSEKPLSCTECGKRFGRKSKLIAHMRIHTGEKPFDCSECGKRFSVKGNLVSHMRSHSGEKPFVCSECGKKFKQNRNLIEHMAVHTEAKPCVCSECGKGFGQNSILRRHMRIHKEAKTFVCSECGKGFGQNSILITHMRIHTGEKPFDCSDCGQRFRQKSNLIAHMRVHTQQKPFGCSECDKRFGKKSDVKRHMRTHTGEKPFDCSVCGKRFGQKATQVTHMKIHTGQKPFGCSECGKKFGWKVSLIAHMKSHKETTPM